MRQVSIENTVISNVDELSAYCAKPMSVEYDKSRPLWAIRVFQDFLGKGQTGIFMYGQHAFTDGMGAICMQLGVSDNYSRDLFPRMPEIPW